MSLLQTHHPQIQVWTVTGVRAHPHVAATNLSPPRSKRGQRRGCECTHSSPPQTRHRQINVHSNRSASAPTCRCHKLITPQIQAWTAMGVQAHPLITATDSTPPEKRAQRQECERTHTSLPQTRHPQIQAWTAMGVRAHPLIAATDSTPPDKRAQRRECKGTHTSLPQTRHPPDPSVDSDGSASAPTRHCQTHHPQIQLWTATEVRAHPHIAATDSSPTEKRGQRRECERTHTLLPLPIIPTHEGSA